MSATSNSMDEIRNILEQVNGVVSARPVIGADDNLNEVHILSRAERSPKQIVRDVESVLKTRFDLELDHRKISVAQIEEDDSDGYFVSRLHPKTIHFSTSGSMMEAKVELFSDDGKDFSGSASGPAINTNRIRLAVAATLAAVEEYLFHMCEFILDDAVQFTVGNFEGILIGLTLVTPKSEESLVGSALIQTDVSEAATKAVLNAVNRRVVMMIAS